jgi:hypothetical protein
MATPARRSTVKFASAATRRTSRARKTNHPSRNTAEARLAAGKSNARTPGSIAHDDCSSAGKRKRRTISASCIFNSPSSRYESPEFSDRLLATSATYDLDAAGASKRRFRRATPKTSRSNVQPSGRGRRALNILGVTFFDVVLAASKSAAGLPSMNWTHAVTSRNNDSTFAKMAVIS